MQQAVRQIVQECFQSHRQQRQSEMPRILQVGKLSGLDSHAL